MTTPATDDSKLVHSDKKFFTAFQLDQDGPPKIIGASQGANPELKFPVEFALKKEWAGQHPRLVTDETEIAAAAKRYRENPASFQHSIPAADHELFTGPLPVFPYNQPHDVGINGFVHLARLAVTWRVTGEDVYLRRLEDWIPFLDNFQPLPTPDYVSVINGKKVTIIGEGNYDLVAGHILFTLSLAYDTLFGKVDARLQAALRQALIAQARLSHADYSRFTTYPYEQNHLTIPVCGLGLAAMALADELPEAKAWGSFVQGLMDRCFESIGYDGWFFEGIQYWSFTMQFTLTYAFAATRLTDCDWFTRPIFKHASRFLSHVHLPDPDFIFDFNDHGPRVETDGVSAQKGYHEPWHTLKTRIYYFLPNLLLRVKPDPLIDAFVRKTAARHSTFERLDALFFMIWPFAPDAEPELADATGAEPPYCYFSDMDIVHWRENWPDRDATAIAFRSSSPAGHHLGRLLPRYPQWKLGIGHAHPDAGSFILYSKGKYLANDTGYTGAKETCDHNSILVDGIGQHQGGTPWATFDAKPYEEYDKIHLENVWTAPHVMAATAQFKNAYDDAMQLRETRRDLILVDGRFLVTLDTMESEVEHDYEWRLHGDREAVLSGDGRFIMENGQARLVFASLNPVASHAIAPTIVETECLFYPHRSRPQQRGFHVALKSARAKRHQFLVAYVIQSSSENASAAQARKISDGKIELSDEKGSCTIWIGDQEEFTGTFAYLLRDSGGTVVSAGLSGSRLSCADFTVDLKGQPDAVTLRPDKTGAIQIEPRPGPAAFTSP